MSPPFRKWKFVLLFRMAGTWGKFFVALGGEAFCRVRLSRPIGRWDAVGYDTRVRHILQTHPTHKTGAKPHHIKHSHLPSKPKTSPQDPHHQKDKANLRSCNGGGLVRKFGVGQGGLEVGRPLRKGSPCASKVFLPPLPLRNHLIQRVAVTERVNVLLAELRGVAKKNANPRALEHHAAQVVLFNRRVGHLPLVG